MNERIQELAEQAELNATLLFNKEKLDKFAELIVRECAKVADETQFKVVNYPVSIAIEKHFGVDR